MNFSPTFSVLFAKYLLFRRWDGIDRGTGFERLLFENESKKIAQKEEAYLWSVADM